MAAILDIKRPLTPDELERQLEPLLKRYRLDVPMMDPDDEHSGGTSSSWEDPSYDRRRAMDDLQEPEWKRYRIAGSLGAPSVDPQEAAQIREDAVRRWAETIVRSLHGCPSVDEAGRRCGQALTQFEGEVRQAVTEETSQATCLGPQHDSQHDVGTDAVAEEPVSDLQHKNRILMRAVHHLADRCKRAEASAAEVPSLQQALEQSLEGQRRLTHSNAVLQEHLKICLNHGCR